MSAGVVTRYGGTDVSGAGFARDVLITSLAPVVWGTTYLITTELLPEGLPMTSGVLRALPAGLLLLAFNPHPIPRQWWGRVAVLGLLNIGFFFPLLFVAAYRLPGGLAAVVGALQPLAIAALSAAMGWGRVRRSTLVWLIVAAGGVALTFQAGDGQPDLIGMVAAISGTLCMAVGILLTRRWGTPEGVRPLTLTGVQLVIGGVAMIPLVPLFDTGTLTLDVGAAIGYVWLSVVGAALAYAVWFRGARVLPATSTSLLGQLSPVTAAILGWLVLQQYLTPLQVLGFGLALAGSLLGQRRRA